MSTNKFWQGHRVSQDPKPKPSTSHPAQVPDYKDKYGPVTEVMEADSMETAHLGELSRGVRKYVHKRAMEGSTPKPKAASDNTRVTPRKKK